MYYNMYYTSYDFPLYYENVIPIYINQRNHNDNTTYMLNIVNSVY